MKITLKDGIVADIKTSSDLWIASECETEMVDIDTTVNFNFSNNAFFSCNLKDVIDPVDFYDFFQQDFSGMNAIELCIAFLLAFDRETSSKYFTECNYEVRSGNIESVKCDFKLADTSITEIKFDYDKNNHIRNIVIFIEDGDRISITLADWVNSFSFLTHVKIIYDRTRLTAADTNDKYRFIYELAKVYKKFLSKITVKSDSDTDEEYYIYGIGFYDKKTDNYITFCSHYHWNGAVYTESHIFPVYNVNLEESLKKGSYMRCNLFG